MAVQSLGRRSTQLLARQLPYKALDGWLQMARAQRPDAGSGLGQVRAWGGGGGACRAAGPRRSWGHSVAGGAGPGPALGIRTVLQRRDGPGGVSASGELPGALPQEEPCSRTPDPRGKPTCTERRGQRSPETTGDSPVPAKGFRAHRTADGGCRGSKVNLLRPQVATRSLCSLSRAPQH